MAAARAGDAGGAHMKAEEFFSQLWDRYIEIAPTAAVIRALVEEQFGEVANDHVAFRTFDQSPIALSDIEKLFLDWGYVRDRSYDFPDKHLTAFGYVPPREHLPLIFLSEFHTAVLPEAEREWVSRVVSEIGSGLSPAQLLLSGRVWQMPSFELYSRLEKVSPYAAWLSVFGLCANHFTIAVHRLPTEPSLGEVVNSLRAAGFLMNEVGGLLKGTPADLLEQASTLAESRRVTFSDGQTHSVPSCYYEFARRYRGPTGGFYPGFVAQSANNIFESTTKQEATSSENNPKRSARKDSP